MWLLFNSCLTDIFSSYANFSKENQVLPSDYCPKVPSSSLTLGCKNTVWQDQFTEVLPFSSPKSVCYQAGEQARLGVAPPSNHSFPTNPAKSFHLLPCWQKYWLLRLAARERWRGQG